jgi:hypothetical protein
MKKSRLILFLTIFMCAASLGIIGRSLPALGVEPKPGDIINSGNVDQYKEYFPSFMVQFIKDGYDGFETPAVIHVREGAPIGLGKVNREGGELNKGKVTLDADGNLVGHVWGIPFIDVQPGDPDAGRKALWNYNYRVSGDDMKAKNYMMFKKRSKTGRLVKGTMDLARLQFSGRAYVDPKPALPDNPNDIWWAQILKSNIAPATGMRTLIWRYNDPSKNDDLWNYIPTLRRTLRMLSSERATPIHGSVTTWDDAGGFDGRMADFNFKMIRQRKMLVLRNTTRWSTDLPNGMIDNLVPCGPDEPYELVNLWEIEITPKNDPRYPFPVRTVWMDPEAEMLFYAEVFDKQGQLWKGQINCTKKQPFADDPDDWVVAQPISITIDVITYAYSVNYSGQWLYNKDELKPPNFDPATLQNF